MNLRFSF